MALVVASNVARTQLLIKANRSNRFYNCGRIMPDMGRTAMIPEIVDITSFELRNEAYGELDCFT